MLLLLLLRAKTDKVEPVFIVHLVFSTLVANKRLNYFSNVLQLNTRSPLLCSSTYSAAQQLA
jgi:hypothetical protein